MSELDDKIRAALRQEDAELFAEHGGEQSMFEMVGDTFRGRSRWMTVLVYVSLAAFLGLAIFTAISFFDAESTRDQIAWAVGFMYSLIVISGLKAWYWTQMNKNALTREIKRLELQIARLSSRLDSA